MGSDGSGAVAQKDQEESKIPPPLLGGHFCLHKLHLLPSLSWCPRQPQLSLSASWQHPACSGRNFSSKMWNTLSPHQPHVHRVPLRTLLSGRVKTKSSFVLSSTPHGAFPWGKGMFSSCWRVSVQTPVCCGVPGREDPCQICSHSMHSHF